MKPSIVSLLIALLIFGGSSVGTALTAPAKVFKVNALADTIDKSPGDGVCADADNRCSLRAAVMEANALFGKDTIQLSAATYLLTRVGAGDDSALNGDLDVSGELSIIGAGKDLTIIDGQGLGDRLFEIQANAVVNLAGITIQNGDLVYADDGGGIFNRGNLSLSDCKLSDNRAYLGGGIYNQSNAVLNIDKCSVSGNTAGNGGGIANFHNLSITNSTISDNDNGEQGGGINHHSGKLTLRNSTISGNTTGTHGGGISITSGETLIINSTISGNTACQTGGGVFAENNKVQIFNSTITRNTVNAWVSTETCPDYGFVVGTGGGIYGTDGQTNLHNSILALNLRVEDGGIFIVDDCRGELGTVRYSLVMNTTGCAFTNDNSLTGQNPKLEVLGDNAGPTQTSALLDSSPAVDAGDPNGCKDKDDKAILADQRGFPRQFDGDENGTARCDIGAYEVVKYSTYNYLPFLGR